MEGAPPAPAASGRAMMPRFRRVTDLATPPLLKVLPPARPGAAHPAHPRGAPAGLRVEHLTFQPQDDDLPNIGQYGRPLFAAGAAPLGRSRPPTYASAGHASCSQAS